MSYCRFGEDSDVYVYLDVYGYLRCCGCSLSDDWEYKTTEDMLSHLAAHQDAFHRVPDYAIERLKADAQETDQWIAAGGHPHDE